MIKELLNKLTTKLPLDINKFSIAQMCSNSDGKTSGSGTMGILICTSGCIAFLYGSFTKSTDILTQSVILVGIGAGLLGYRKGKDTKLNAIDPTLLSEPTENSSSEISDSQPK